MAAIVEIDQTNGTAPGTLTDGVLNVHHGSIDAVNLDADANPISAGSNGFEQWLQVHLVDLSGSVNIQDLRVWSGTSRPTGCTFGFNGSTVEAVYDSANHKQTVYATPNTNNTRTPETLPTSQPASANEGIGGNLNGVLSAPGRSDFILMQMRFSALATAGYDPAVNFDFVEVA